MFIRLSRLRFIFIRSCLFSCIVILCLQILSLFNKDILPSNELSTFEQRFWRKLSREDEKLTDEQRIEQIKLVNNRNTPEEHNWTRIFYDSYTKKLAVLNERDSKSNYKHRFQENPTNLSQSTFEIYEETMVFERPKFCSSTRIFHPQCPFSNCQWTCAKPSMNSNNLRRASVFHYADINSVNMQEKLTHRSSKDIWILWIDEANQDIHHFNQYLFNWTLTFRKDSEVSIGSYGILIQRTTKIIDFSFNNSELFQILRHVNIHTTNPYLEYRIFMNFRSRRKHALWFVSNCGPQHRLNYYNQLKSSYSIRAFGSCVESKCDKNHHCESDQSHLAMFYLAFESQTCTDYITEKFWRALYYGMIPIVLGPTKQSYLDLGVPQSSFIHIDQFQSPTALADHLHRIANDYLLYREYFQWLNQSDIFYDINELEPIRMCELCMRLNLQEYRDHQFYNDLQAWHQTGC